MCRSALVITLATGLAIACSSGSNSGQPAAGEQPAASPAAAPAAAGTAQAGGAGSGAQAAAPAPQAASPAPAPQAGGQAAAAAAPPRAAAPAAPTSREVTIPAGTTLDISLTTSIASDTSQVEDPVRGTLARPLVVSGVTAVPSGAELTGSVLEAKKSGRVQGRAEITFRFDRLLVRDETLQIQTSRVLRQAASSTKKDVERGAIGAGIGAVVGGIVGGGKGAAIGATAGGAGTVLATRGNEVRLAAGTRVRTTLQEPLTVVVPLRER
jgi:hypothetical protein